MTAAQKSAKEKFKKAIEYRKKTGVSLKEAFAHVYGKKVGAVKKKTAPKKKAAVKKAAPKKKAASKKKAAVKKVAPKKKAVVKKAEPKKKVVPKKITGSHKDTKSHNVNIRVVSGIGKISSEFINDLKSANDKLIRYQNVLLILIDQKNSQTLSPIRKKTIAFDIKTIKNIIKEQKIHIRELKKNIK
jgi:hypothetical protein